MKRVTPLAALLLVTACGDNSSTPQVMRKTGAAEPSTAATPPPQSAGGAGPGSNLSGYTSALSGAVSDFAVERTEFGTRVQLAADTLFEFDKAVLTPDAETNLKRAAELVRQGGSGAVTVVGHTDAKGDEAYNLELSKRRAEAVAAWLRNEPGLNSRAFAVEGRGEAEPVASNTRPDGSDDPDGRARNRRVTIDIPR